MQSHARSPPSCPECTQSLHPLDVRDEPNWLTGYKLDRLERDAPQCLAALGSSPLSFSQVPDERTGEGCGFTNAVDVVRSSTSFSSGFKASCPLAVGWALFELHVLQQVAREHMGQEVVRVDHLGTYACRNQYHRDSGRRSEHATANAIDIAGFVLADGTTISVLSDWNGPPNRLPSCGLSATGRAASSTWCSSPGLQRGSSRPLPLRYG